MLSKLAMTYELLLYLQPIWKRPTSGSNEFEPVMKIRLPQATKLLRKRKQKPSHLKPHALPQYLLRKRKSKKKNLRRSQNPPARTVIAATIATEIGVEATIKTVPLNVTRKNNHLRTIQHELNLIAISRTVTSRIMTKTNAVDVQRQLSPKLKQKRQNLNAVEMIMPLKVMMTTSAIKVPVVEVASAEEVKTATPRKSKRVNRWKLNQNRHLKLQRNLSPSQVK